MKNQMLGLWLSGANRAAGWWMGHAMNAVRQGQRTALDEMTKAIALKPKRKARARPKRRTG